ncbi:MAG: OadG family protein [Lachnospiraceae bacterium]|nr:OadG family protein [Lachnospiraceae bacterium]
MKRRLSAVLLATGLAVSALSMGVYAEETETTVTEQVTEAVTEKQTESTEAEDATESLTEAESALEAAAAEAESAAEAAAEAEDGEDSEAANTEATIESYMKQSLEQLLTQLGSMTDEQLQEIIDNGDASSALIASNWMSVKEDLGNLVELADPEVTTTDALVQAVSEVKYDGVNDKTKVLVTYEVDQAQQTFSISWDVQYPLSTLMAQAGMNTLMGVGIVFLTLLFLSWLIGKLHIIPDMIEARTKKNTPAQIPISTPAPAPAPVVEEEEELVDDCELVAVIAAAIAAAENTSTDGFVVRSIKKANKRNWQRA